jgi:membrane protease YdiL (CAAX protease family)
MQTLFHLLAHPLFYYGVVLAGIAVLLRINRVDPLKTLTPPSDPKLYLSLLCLELPAICVHWGLVAISVSLCAHFWPGLIYESFVQSALVPVTGWSLMLRVVLIGPVLEEFLFRAGIFERAKSHMGVYRAAYLSAALFAAVHINPMQIPGTFVFGLIMAASYHRSGSLVFPITLHALNNLFSAGAQGFSNPIDWSTANIPAMMRNYESLWTQGLVLVLVGLPSLVLLLKGMVTGPQFVKLSDISAPKIPRTFP